MRDEEFVFREESNGKKAAARGIYHMNRRGKGGVVLPYDTMTVQQKKELIKPVQEYNLKKPMNKEQFKMMPEDLQREYLQGLYDTYGVSDADIGGMLGTTRQMVGVYRKTLGVRPALTRGGRNKAPGEKWNEFLDSVASPVTYTDADAPIELEVSKTAEKPKAIPVCEPATKSAEIRQFSFRLDGVEKIGDIAVLLLPFFAPGKRLNITISGNAEPKNKPEGVSWENDEM